MPNPAEKAWTFIDINSAGVIVIIGFYCSFLFSKPETIIELVVGALYCLVGLALLSMCFELMKEEFVSKVRWIGRSLRIVRSNNGEDVEEIVEESGVAGNFDEARRDSHYTNTSFGNLTKLDIVDTPTTKRETHCHSGNLLRSTSPPLRKSTCVLRPHSGQCSGNSRASMRRFRTSGVSPTKSLGKGDSLTIGFDDFGLMTPESDIRGEGNEAFGGDMTVDSEEVMEE